MQEQHSMTIKTFAAALMATTLLAAPALAEDTMQKSTTPPPATTNAAPAATSAQTAQQSDQWRGSKLVGLNVYNGNNEKIGDINELITGKDGQIDLVVVGVGGFLGMGEHNVALKWNELKFVTEPVRSASTTTTTTTRPAPSGTTTTRTTGSGATAPVNAATTVRDYPDHAMVNMTKDQLKALPAFTYASQAKKG
jgi:hypothetical protein